MILPHCFPFFITVQQSQALLQGILLKRFKMNSISVGKLNPPANTKLVSKMLLDYELNPVPDVVCMLMAIRIIALLILAV